MKPIGTPLSPSATRVMLLGSGELGKEVLIALQRLGVETIAVVQQVIRDSLLLALADPGAALPTMREHAQEHDDTVLMQHVDVYVNDWTVDLGGTGLRALDELSARAASIGLGTGRRLQVFSG